MSRIKKDKAAAKKAAKQAELKRLLAEKEYTEAAKVKILVPTADDMPPLLKLGSSYDKFLTKGNLFSKLALGATPPPVLRLGSRDGEFVGFKFDELNDEDKAVSQIAEISEAEKSKKTFFSEDQDVLLDAAELFLKAEKEYEASIKGYFFKDQGKTIFYDDDHRTTEQHISEQRELKIKSLEKALRADDKKSLQEYMNEKQATLDFVSQLDDAYQTEVDKVEPAGEASSLLGWFGY